ncbi:MAG: MerC domain-containing protein [Novosphingobium sp.]
MRTAILSIRDRLDRVGVMISGLCALHCIAGLVVVTVLGLGGEALLSPAIHRVGLAIAVAVGAFSLGLGALRHGKRGPLVIGCVGLSLMATSLFVSHGAAEAFLTIPGVALVAFAHLRNLRHTA